MSEHEHHEHHDDRVHPESVVLDIGGDIGAMLLYTSAERRGQEIEISPKSAPDHRTHVEILERPLPSGETVFAGAYYGLREGDYLIWGEQDSPVDEVHVKGGQITTVDWRE